MSTDNGQDGAQVTPSTILEDLSRGCIAAALRIHDVASERQRLLQLDDDRCLAQVRLLSTHQNVPRILS